MNASWKAHPMAEEANYLYLNRDGGWLDFSWSGLELNERGALELEALPLLAGRPPDGLRSLAAPDGPAGVAVDSTDAVYWTDPSANAVWWREACFGTVSQMLCIGGGDGQGPGQLRTPRGLLHHPIRGSLLVADSANHRIQLFDARTFGWIGVWGQSHPSSVDPSSDPGRLNTPWSLAVAADGSVFAADRGNLRVQKFTIDGRVVRSFWQTVSQQAVVPQDAAEVAVAQAQQAELVWILDRAKSALHAYDTSGVYVRSVDMQRGGQPLAAPMGLAVTGKSIYIGDNAANRLYRFHLDGRLVGEANGWNGPVAAIAWDKHDGLWVHPDGGLAPLRLEERGASRSQGAMVGGPFLNLSGRDEQWHRLKATALEMPAGAHLRLFTYSSRQNQPPAYNLDASNSFPAPGGWRAVAQDVGETVIPGAPLDYVWVGVVFASEGVGRPALGQMRLEFDHESLLRHLPPLYAEKEAARKFLVRFLTLFESLLDDVEGRTRHMATLFDPAATPAAWLDWLAGWLALDLSEAWDEPHKRRAVARAFESYAMRGTAEGLRATVRSFTGLDTRIVEPALGSDLWCLADAACPDAEQACSVLGFTTMLVGAEPGGAVLGTTATLDASHLIAEDEYGQPLFTDVAHQFTVQVYRGPGFSASRLTELHELLERERPAHTTYHVCVVDPKMRIGFQSTLGVDTVVAGPPLPSLAGEPGTTVDGFVLGGDPPGRLNSGSRVGQTTRLE
jgi:phage tail-like protein